MVDKTTSISPTHGKYENGLLQVMLKRKAHRQTKQGFLIYYLQDTDRRSQAANPVEFY